MAEGGPEVKGPNKSSNNPLNYNLKEIRKTTVALVVATLALLAFFIEFKPDFDQAVIMVVGQS